MDSRWMTARQAAGEWGVSLRYVQRLLAEGRVSGVKKYGRSWMIPSGAGKPGDSQAERPPKIPAGLPCLSLMWEGFWPIQEIDTGLPTVETAALRNQGLAEVAYLRGDFVQAKRYAVLALEHEATFLCAALFLLLIAISTNDFDLYSRIEASLKRRIENADEPRVAALAEIVLATVAVSMFAPEMVPGWLKEGEFSRLPEAALPFALYLRIKYLQNLADYPQMRAVAQAMLTLCKGKSAMMDIYLLLMCAAACVGLGKKGPARDYLLEALALGLPQGYITPFVENIANLSGLIEECVMQQYPYAYDALLAQWQETWRNWAVFHNRFARDNVTLLLTLREFRIATLAANRTPYAEIARQECLSVGRIRNILQDIYGKLFVRNRDELAVLVLWTPKKT